MNVLEMEGANEGNKEDREEGTNNGDEEGKCRHK
jgi:hypothetical protein